GTRATPRFVRPASRHRRSRLGLYCLGPRPAAGSPVRGGGSVASAVRELGAWGGTVIPVRPVGTVACLRRSAGYHWSHAPKAPADRPDAYRTTPWRR
ncbi:MAG: hypothetical protein ACXWN2_02025, partial [Candidatus Limnocylindrales bacterium]